jgi:hypothetical protein
MSPTSPRNVAASTGPTPNSSQQAGVGLGDGGLDAGLDGGDPLLQLADIGDQASGQRPASYRRRTSGCDPG